VIEAPPVGSTDTVSGSGSAPGPGEPLLPVFETNAREVFGFRELKANFWIVNSGGIFLSLPHRDDPQGVEFDLFHLHEGELVFTDRARFATPPQARPEPPPPPTAAAEPARDAPTDARSACVRRVRLDLLRGRNIVVLTRPGDASWRLEFRLMYKTPLRDWVESILKALIILVLIQFFVIQTFYIPTGSMKNTLLPRDFIMVEKVTYLFGPPRRGDVVVFQFPEDPRKDFIKRMIAGEGDKIEIVRQSVRLNGQVLVEPYVSSLESEGRPTLGLDRDFFGPQIVPDRAIFVMGDNRNNSLDSRTWGHLPLFRLKGKAFLAYWPRTRFGMIRHVREPFAALESAPQ
jgi:signal peptidase I